MKKIFLIVFLLLGLYGFSQPIVNRSGNANTVVDYRWGSLYNMFAPRYFDTTAANLQKGIDSCGAIIYCYNTNSLWLRKCSPKRWAEFSVGSGGSDTVIVNGNFWGVDGNSFIGSDLSEPSIGVVTSPGDAFGMWFLANGVRSLYFPPNGLSLLNDTTNTKVMTFNPTTKNWGYSNWLGSGGGGSITASNGLTKVGSDIRLGGTLTGATTIDGDGNDFEISGVNSMYLRNTNSFSFGSFYIESNYSEMSGQTSSNVTSFIRTYGDSIVLYPHQSNLYIDSLSTITTFPRYNVMLRDTVNGKVVSVPQGLLGGYWTASGNDIYNNNSGNVGIGTTTPVYPLDVNSKIGVGGTQMVYLPNQTNFTGSIFYGNGGTNLSHTSGSTGQYNTGVGVNALDSAQTAYFNTAFGANALKNLTTGHSNTAVGVNAMISNKSGTENTAVGLNALYTNLGDYNTGVGYNALLNNSTGQTNVAIGDNAMKDNTTGLQNTVAGYRAFQSNTIGYFNDFYGYRSGESYTAAVGCVGIGNYALGKDLTGRYNTAVGFFAGYDMQVSDSTAGYNVFLGSSSGDNIVTGKFNTILGAGTTGSSALRSSILLGYGATTSTNNRFAISDSITSYYEPNVPYSGSASDSMLVWNPVTKLRGMRAIPTGGGSSSLTSTYVGFGNSGNTITGSPNFIYDSASTELRIGGIADQGAYQLQMSGAQIFRYGADNSYALTLRPSGASDPYTPLIAWQATGVNTNKSRMGNDYGGRLNIESADSYLGIGSFYSSLPNVKIRTYSYSSGSGADAATIQIRNPDAAAIGLSIKAYTSATGDLLQFLNSGGTIMSVVDKTGNLGIGTTAPSSTLEVTGSVEFSGYSAKTAAYTLTNADYIINVTANSNNYTLPTAVGITGRIYTIKNSGSGAPVVNTTSSQTIDGATTYTLSAQYKYVTVISDGANWLIIANN